MDRIGEISVLALIVVVLHTIPLTRCSTSSETLQINSQPNGTDDINKSKNYTSVGQLQKGNETIRMELLEKEFKNASKKGSKVVNFSSTTPLPIMAEWGGNCTAKNWKACSNLKRYFSYYVDPKDPEKKLKHHEIDCTLQPILCLKNGWTVSRCQILCMGRCNRDMMSKYDQYVVKEGQC